MGDYYGISTNFTNMGFNALSNSEYEYGQNLFAQNNDSELTVGDSLVLAATSNKLVSSNNGSVITGDLTSNATATGLLNTITSVDIGDNLTVVAGTNKPGVTTAPIIYSANGVKYYKSALAAANYPANVVYYNKSQKVFYVGNTTTDTTATAAITYVPPTGQGMALAAGAGGVFTAVAANRCTSFWSAANGVAAGPLTFVGGSTAGGVNATIGFSANANLAGITAYQNIAGLSANSPVGLAGRINALAGDDGLTDRTNYFVLVGGAFAGAAGISNLLYTSRALAANPADTDDFVSVASAVAIFPTGAAASSVNAIAFNGSVFLVGGLGNDLNGGTNSPVVAISAFAAGAFTFDIPTGCNIGDLVTNVNSLTWNGTYWIAGCTNANGFVLLKSVDAVTWSYVSGAVAGATTALAVASKHSVDARIP